MQIKLLATGQSPDYYTFNGEVITAYHDGVSEVYDFSGMPEGATFQGADPVNGVPAIRNAERVNGELQVTLCQQVGPGHWQESDWMDSSSYDPDTVHVEYMNKPHAGTPWAKVKSGKAVVVQQ